MVKEDWLLHSGRNASLASHFSRGFLADAAQLGCSGKLLPA